MKNLKRFGMVFLGVVLSLVVIAFIPAGIKSAIPGARSIQ